jgi:hypothetical protein
MRTPKFGMRAFLAQALALYWASRGLSLGPRRERYSVAPLSGRLASA